MTFGLFVGLAMLLLVAVAVLLTLDRFRSDSASDSAWVSDEDDHIPKSSTRRHDYGHNIWTN